VTVTVTMTVTVTVNMTVTVIVNMTVTVIVNMTVTVPSGQSGQVGVSILQRISESTK
jgi:hypothetical protein